MKQSIMSSVLDIDLDYFVFLDDPLECLDKLLEWAGEPIAFIAERHNRHLRQWKALVKRGTLSVPTHILHVDQHHDMMDQQVTPNIANFVYHAMREWPECRVHWLVDRAIDSPDMWIQDDEWESLARRFSSGPRRPRGWPRPDLVSVCTSPEFVSPDLEGSLLKRIEQFNESYGRPSPRRVK